VGEKRKSGIHGVFAKAYLGRRPKQQVRTKKEREVKKADLPAFPNSDEFAEARKRAGTRGEERGDKR